MKEKMPADVRERINKMEAEGLYGHGKDYEKNRYTAEYMTAAWGDGYFPYIYQNHPDANYDPVDDGKMSWDLYREMWGSHGEFVIDGNLKSVEYTDRLSTIKVPTLILVGDHDESDPSLSQTIHKKDRWLEAGDPAEIRPHDFRGPAGNVPEGSRRIPGEVSGSGHGKDGGRGARPSFTAPS